MVPKVAFPSFPAAMVNPIYKALRSVLKFSVLPLSEHEWGATFSERSWLG